jgi:Ran GTPase-activating protein (RanGAP) involved in mRNA processing and transport
MRHRSHLYILKPNAKTLFLRQIKTTNGHFLVLNDKSMELLGSNIMGIHYDTLSNKNEMNLKKCDLRKLLSQTTLKRPSKKERGVDWNSVYKLKLSDNEMQLSSDKHLLSFRRQL